MDLRDRLFWPLVAVGATCLGAGAWYYLRPSSDDVQSVEGGRSTIEEVAAQDDALSDPTQQQDVAPKPSAKEGNVESRAPERAPAEKREAQRHLPSSGVDVTRLGLNLERLRGSAGVAAGSLGGNRKIPSPPNLDDPMLRKRMEETRRLMHRPKGKE